jgi:hypothetical protein
MKRLLPVAVMLALLPLLCAAARPGPSPQPKRILMIGNSLTYTYGIPSILEKFAEASKKKLSITAHTAGGKDLAWHWANPNRAGGMTAKEEIEKGGFDLVIVQEYSNVLQKAEGRESFQKMAPEYVKAIRAKSMKAMLYMAHPTAKAVDAKQLKPIVEGNTEMSQKLDVACAPVALAFIAFNEKYPKIALIDAQTDRKYGTGKAMTHQSPFGSYLAACVLYAAIYHESPVGLSFAGAFDGKKEIPIEAADAKAAQEVAWEVWREFESKHPVKGAK